MSKLVAILILISSSCLAGSAVSLSVTCNGVQSNNSASYLPSLSCGSLSGPAYAAATANNTSASVQTHVMSPTQANGFAEFFDNQAILTVNGGVGTGFLVPCIASTLSNGGVVASMGTFSYSPNVFVGSLNSCTGASIANAVAFTFGQSQTLTYFITADAFGGSGYPDAFGSVSLAGYDFFDSTGKQIFTPTVTLVDSALVTPEPSTHAQLVLTLCAFGYGVRSGRAYISTKLR